MDKIIANVEELKKVFVMDNDTIADFVNSEEIRAHELLADILESAADPEDFKALNELDQDAYICETAYRYGMTYALKMLSKAIDKSIDDFAGMVQQRSEGR